jgi:hypothetical protein
VGHLPKEGDVRNRWGTILIVVGIAGLVVVLLYRTPTPTPVQPVPPAASSNQQTVSPDAKQVARPIQPNELSPGFREAALDATDAVYRLPIYGRSEAAELEPRKLEAEKAVMTARRKVQTEADKHIYDLLHAYYEFGTAVIFEDQQANNENVGWDFRLQNAKDAVPDAGSATQCLFELRVTLKDTADLPPDQIEAGHNIRCLSALQQLEERLGVSK